MNHAPRMCVFTERQVGIGSAAGAIEPHLRAYPNTSWVDVTYVEPGGWVEQLKLPGRLGGTLRGVLQTSDALRRGPYDALFFLTHNPAVFQQLAVARTPTVLWTDVTPALLDAQAEQYGHPVDRVALVGRAKRFVVERTFRNAALCVGWSEWARRSFVNDYGVPEQKTEVVPPGIDLSRFQALEAPPAEGLPRLLFVGGDFVRKGGDLLLEVYREQFRGRCELDLVTRDAVAEEPGVRVHHGLTATSPALLELYRRAAAFVLPTRGDCFSIASMEAMAMGLPVVVSGVGGIPEIVENERSGYLVPPNDGRELSRALSSLLENHERRRALGRRGREIVEARFNARKTAERLYELLCRVARRSDSRQ